MGPWVNPLCFSSLGNYIGKKTYCNPSKTSTKGKRIQEFRLSQEGSYPHFILCEEFRASIWNLMNPAGTGVQRKFVADPTTLYWETVLLQLRKYWNVKKWWNKAKKKKRGRERGFILYFSPHIFLCVFFLSDVMWFHNNYSLSSLYLTAVCWKRLKKKSKHVKNERNYSYAMYNCILYLNPWTLSFKLYLVSTGGEKIPLLSGIGNRICVLFSNTTALSEKLLPGNN